MFKTYCKGQENALNSLVEEATFSCCALVSGKFILGKQFSLV